MASRIRLNTLEQRILDRILLSGDGFEDVEEMLAALGAGREAFVEALERLEEEGCISVSYLGANIIVAYGDPLAELFQGIDTRGKMRATDIGHC